MGKTVYLSEEEVTFPIIMKTDRGDFVKREIVASVIDSEEVNFLCGKETIKKWKTKVDFEEYKQEFKAKDNNVELIESEGGHLLARLELVGTWKNDKAFYLVEKDDVSSDGAVKKIYKILNLKSKEQMYYAYRNVGKLNEEVKKTIDAVVDKCEICNKNSHSKSRPSVAVPRGTDFNSVIAVDLKVVGDKYILWMICGFTKFIRGVILKDKTPESVIKGLHGAWCMDLRFPTV